MKKLFFGAIIALTTATPALADQIIDENGIKADADIDTYDCISPKFTSDNKAYLYGEYCNEDRSVKYIGIYDDDIQKVKDFSINAPENSRGYRVTKQRARVDVVDYSITKGKEFSTTFASDDEVKSYLLTNEDFVVDSTFVVDGVKLFVSFSRTTFWKESKYGHKYPWTNLYGTVGDHLYPCGGYLSEKETYTGEWTEETGYGSPDWESYFVYLKYYDTSEDDSDNSLDFSQTFFNSDSKYEFIQPCYELVEDRHESDWDYDGEVDHIDIYLLLSAKL